jgi:hypothetical protein
LNCKDTKIEPQRRQSFFYHAQPEHVSRQNFVDTVLQWTDPMLTEILLEGTFRLMAGMQTSWSRFLTLAYLDVHCQQSLIGWDQLLYFKEDGQTSGVSFSRLIRHYYTFHACIGLSISLLREATELHIKLGRGGTMTYKVVRQI